MTENQKLREAFESRMTDNGKWPNAIKQGRNGCYLLAQTENAWTEWQACAEALALPTADHLPDAGKMINGLTQAETDASASVSGLTAAPVDERERFEQFAQNCPMGKYNVARRGEGYDSSHTQIMWDAWQARAALSAGDAADVQRWKTSELISRTALTPPKHRTETESIAFNAYRKAMESGQSYAACVDAAIDCRETTVLEDLIEEFGKHWCT